MTKWEYQVSNIETSAVGFYDKLNALLNEQGEKGWELMQIMQHEGYTSVGSCWFVRWSPKFGQVAKREFCS
jgi:hypothetical protein